MSLTITKVPAKEKTKLISKHVTEEQKLIDELVELAEVIKPLESKMKRYDEIKKLLQSIAKTFPPEQEAVLSGTIGEATLSKCRTETTITNMQAIHDQLGDEAFMALVKISITDLKAYLSEIEIAKVTEKSLGPRSLKAVKRFVA